MSHHRRASDLKDAECARAEAEARRAERARYRRERPAANDHTPEALNVDNRKAFRDTIAWSEIGPALLSMTFNGYNVLVGSTPAKPLVFKSFAAHPRIHSDALNSDAAGRYQFLGRYWLPYKLMLKLPDFGPEAQDRWCDQLIRECRALDDVDAGRIESAISKCASRWASLPGNSYGQHTNKVSDLIAAYKRAGGQLA